MGGCRAAAAAGTRRCRRCRPRGATAAWDSRARRASPSPSSCPRSTCSPAQWGGPWQARPGGWARRARRGALGGRAQAAAPRVAPSSGQRPATPLQQAPPLSVSACLSACLPVCVSRPHSVAGAPRPAPTRPPLPTPFQRRSYSLSGSMEVAQLLHRMALADGIPANQVGAPPAPAPPPPGARQRLVGRGMQAGTGPARWRAARGCSAGAGPPGAALPASRPRPSRPLSHP